MRFLIAQDIKMINDELVLMFKNVALRLNSQVIAYQKSQELIVPENILVSCHA